MSAPVQHRPECSCPPTVQRLGMRGDLLELCDECGRYVVLVQHDAQEAPRRYPGSLPPIPQPQPIQRGRRNQRATR